MEFRNKSAIYLQIAEEFALNILKYKWKSDEKVPSVRELAIELEVNPNTVMRTYSHLQDLNIIYNKRGIGYFISPDAHSIVTDMLKKQFKEEDLPLIFNKMHLLNISIQELETYFNEWKKNKNL